MTNLFLFFHNTQRHSKLLYSSLISIFSLCCRFRFKNAHTKRHIKHKKKSIYYFALFFTHNKLFILYVAGKFFIFIIFFFVISFHFIYHFTYAIYFAESDACMAQIRNWKLESLWWWKGKKTSFSIELIAFSSWRHNQSAFWCPAFCGKIKSFFVIQNHNNWPRCCLPLSLLPSSASDWNNFAFLIL